MTVHVIKGADGLPRRGFTVADVRRMIDAGILAPDENLELIDGDLVPMAAKYHAHERIKSGLILAIVPVLPAELWIGVESSIRLSETTLVEPDIVVYRRALDLHDVRGPDLLLVVEVADTTLSFDKGRKAALYARHDTRELWVIDANQRVAWVHRIPLRQGFRDVTMVAAEDELRPAAPDLAGFSVRLSDLG